jgi:hypothetical protein
MVGSCEYKKIQANLGKMRGLTKRGFENKTVKRN